MKRPVATVAERPEPSCQVGGDSAYIIRLGIGRALLGFARENELTNIG